MSSEYEFSNESESILSSNSDFEFTEDQQQIIKETEIEERVTSNLMTKYEKAHILGVRAMQIAKNAPIFTDIGDLTDPLKIAIKELNEKKIPFIIKRRMPDGKCEKWKLNELLLPDEFDV